VHRELTACCVLASVVVACRDGSTRDRLGANRPAPEHAHWYDRVPAAETPASFPTPTPGPPPISACETFDAQHQCALWAPALIDVIAEPRVWDGRRIRVRGFLNFEFEGDAIYVSRDDRHDWRVECAVWVSVPHAWTERRLPNQRDGVVEGTFRSQRRGHMGLFAGAIDDVTRIETVR
jgi:hypothetical protein